MKVLSFAYISFHVQQKDDLQMVLCASHQHDLSLSSNKVQRKWLGRQRALDEKVAIGILISAADR